MYNSKVVRNMVGTKGLPIPGTGGTDAVNRAINLRNEEQYLREQATFEEIEKNSERRNIQNIALESQMMGEKKWAILDGLNKSSRGLVFKEIMFEAFIDALVLDEDFKEEQSENFRALVESYIDERGGYEMLTRAYGKTKSPILKGLIEACESVAGKVCNRKDCECNEGKINVDEINFDINDDEREELSFAKDKLSLDQIAGLVKKKVIDVIKDEKSREAKEAELEKDLEDQANAIGVPVEEAASMFFMNIHGFGTVQESTIFNSIQRDSFKVAMESTAALHADAEQQDDDFADEEFSAKVNNTIDDVKRNEFEPYTMKDAMKSEYSLEDEEDAYKLDSANPLNDELYALDLDLVLAESITKYTLMEMFHTIKLEDHDYNSLRKLSQSLLNK